MYTCPMHPEIVQDKPGMCPECGMSLIPQKHGARSAEHEKVHKDRVHDTSTAQSAGKHAGHKTASFLTKFWVTLTLTLPILAYSDIFTIATGVELPRFEGMEFVILALGSVVFFYGGWIFISSAYRELRARSPGMMTLIALAITA